MTIKEIDFLIFDSSNPGVYTWFKRLALQMIYKGATRISSKHLIEIIRSEQKIKISNNTTAYYSRKFMREYKQHEGVFLIKPTK